MNSMKFARRLAVAWIILFLLLPYSPAQAQSEGVSFFPETGHFVKGKFLEFYNSAKQPLLVYGYPITEQMTSKDGKTVQYFQRARFELGRDLFGNPAIHLTPLGEVTYQPDSQLRLENPVGCQVFLSGHRVCYAFLDFFKTNGGVAQFGNPISPFEFHDGVIVQYFERARFEWRADRPEDQRVVVSDLGRVYFDQLGEDTAQLKPVTPQDATINPVLSIKVRAFVQKPVMSATGQQTVYVFVHNQTQQAVSNANGKVVIHWTDGSVEEYFFTTNASGVGTASFSFSEQEKGMLVPIDIVVAYQGLTSVTTTSFRIWY